MGNDHLLHLVGAGYGLPADAVIFQMVPDLLVGVELRGIRRQAEERELTFGRFHEPRNQCRPVDRVAVDDQEYGIGPVVYQPLKEIDEDLARNLTLDQHKSHGTPG